MSPTDHRSQTVLSSYFSPSPTKPGKRRARPDSPIDLTSDAEDEISSSYIDEPPIKKIKVVRPSQSQSRPSSSLTSSKKPSATPNYTQSLLFSQTLSQRSNARYETPAAPRSSAGAAAKWAFVPQTSSPQSHLSPGLDSRSGHDANSKAGSVKETEKVKRREPFKKKLLSHDTQFYLRHGPRGDTTLDAHSEPPDPDDLMDEPAEEDSGAEVDSDPEYTKLMRIFSHKDVSSTKGKGRDKQNTSASSKGAGRGSNQPQSTGKGQKGKKAPQKIGPSGKTYTPLELQVRLTYQGSRLGL